MMDRSKSLLLASVAAMLFMMPQTGFEELVKAGFDAEKK